MGNHLSTAFRKGITKLHQLFAGNRFSFTPRCGWSDEVIDARITPV
jgi:hypothetical protein